MKELEFLKSDKIEVVANQKKQVEHQLIGKIIPHEGHVIWQINKETLEIDLAKYSNATYVIGGEPKREIITKDGFAYVSALNKKNALRKYKAGKDGGKQIDQEPLKINA